MALARFFLLTLFSLFFAVAAQAEGQRVILVLDASGSMWGQIGGKTKIEIAKDVVGKVVSKWNPQDELGLVVYGHREKGSCSDIETLIEPGLLDAGRYMSAVKGITPKGKTPMTQAIRQAAESLKFTEQKATVILVSDGIETCDPDPCAVAAELEKMGVGLTVHTVGFGLDDQGAVQQLQCLANNTGGISILAQNAGELESALEQTVQAGPAPAPAPQPEPVAEFNLTGNVIMSEGVETLPNEFDTPSWEVFKSINGEKGDWIKTEYHTPIKTKIDEPGEYIVQVNNDQARVSTPITIEPGKPVNLDLSFEAGMITFTGMMDDTQPVTDSGAAWELLDGNGKWITTKYGPTASFFTNAGAYQIKLTLGTASVTQNVSFVSGQIEKKQVSLGGGTIKVKAMFAPGGPALLDGAAVELQKGAVNIDGKHEWITTQYGPEVEFKAPAGKYRLQATQDFATGFADVDLTAGQMLPVEVSVNAGFLAVTAPADSVIELYTVEKDIAGKRKHIGTDYNGKMNRAVGAGTVHMIVSKQGGDVITEKDVEIKAGQRTEVSVP